MRAHELSPDVSIDQQEEKVLSKVEDDSVFEPKLSTAHRPPLDVLIMTIQSPSVLDSTTESSLTRTRTLTA